MQHQRERKILNLLIGIYILYNTIIHSTPGEPLASPLSLKAEKIKFRLKQNNEILNDRCVLILLQLLKRWRPHPTIKYQFFPVLLIYNWGLYLISHGEWYPHRVILLVHTLRSMGSSRRLTGARFGLRGNPSARAWDSEATYRGRGDEVRVA